MPSPRVVSLHLCERIEEHVFGRVSIIPSISHIVAHLPQPIKDYSVFVEMSEVMEETDITIYLSACGSSVPDFKSVGFFTLEAQPSPLAVARVEIQLGIGFPGAGWYMISVHHGGEMLGSRAIHVIDAKSAHGKMPSKGVHVITTRDQDSEPSNRPDLPPPGRGANPVEERQRGDIRD